MLPILTRLIFSLDDPDVVEAGVIRWSSPVPVFGDIETSKVATLGLNPSNREFMDEKGRELTGNLRRFHTLRSLGLDSWAEVNSNHLSLIMDTFLSYFASNPYDVWFKKLDQVVIAAGASYYDISHQACHLDLIPYATEQKWTELTTKEKSTLLQIAGDSLSALLTDSDIRILILNGSTVISQFEAITGIFLERNEMPEWTLPRKSGSGVIGVAYTGLINELLGDTLENDIQVLGFNHNLQSSFGVTRHVVNKIRDWVAINTR